MHHKSQFLWHSSMCNTSHCGFVVPQKRSFTKRSVLFYPDVSCRWIKLEFINCIKKWKYDVLLGSVTSNWSVHVNLLFPFSAPSQQVLFIFLHWFSERVKTEKQVCMDFCSLSTQVSFVTNKLKWKWLLPLSFLNVESTFEFKIWATNEGYLW